MNKLLTVVAAAALLCAAPRPSPPTPSAAEANEPTNSQQDKMAACNKQAGDKKGDDRKAFMKTCLSNAPAEAHDPEREDVDVQQEDRGHGEGRALQGAKRVHEGGELTNTH